MGHYCRICGRTRANERFSGKGHKKHICEECSKLSVTENDEMTIVNQIYSLCRYINLSKANRRMLEGYLQHKSDKVRAASKEILKEFALFKYNDLPELNDDYEDDCNDDNFDLWVEDTGDEDNYISDEDDLPF